MGYQAGMNVGQYVGSQPIAFVDPMGLHRDFNPGGPRPKRIPPGGIKWDVSAWSSSAMHVGLYDFYLRLEWWVWDDGKSAEYLILGGDFLWCVQGQSEQQEFYASVDASLRSDANGMFSLLQCDQSDTFTDRGSRLITADFGSPNVRLSMQGYTVYWEADCGIVKKCNVPMAGCDDKCGSKAIYVCDVSWTLYDYYDFPIWMVVGWIGHPFHIYGYWQRPASGAVWSCDNG